MVAVLGMATARFRRRGLGLLPRNLPASWNASRPDSTASSCSRPPCTATSAASSWRPSARTRGPRTACRPTFVQDNHSRSRRGTLRGIHFQTHPGQGKLVRVRARARARRRRRPAARLADVRRVGGVRARRRARRASCGSRSASGTASACSPRRPTSSTSARPTTTRRPRRASASTTPTSASSGRRTVELLYSERDRDAPRLAEVADALPFATRVSGDGRFAPSPTGHAAPRQPAHGAARVAVRALGRARASWCGWRTSTRAACAPGSASEQLERPAPRSGSTGTARSSSSRRAHDAYEAAIARLRARRARVRVLLHAGRDPRGGVGAARAAARGRLPGHVPAADRRRAAAQARRRAAAGAAACAPTPRASRFDGPAARARTRASSTTSSCAATTARPPTTSRSWSTTRRRASARSCAAPTCSTRRRASSCSRGLLGLPEPSWAHVPLVLGPRRGAAGQAPRGGDAARGRRRARRCAGWRGRSASRALRPPPRCWRRSIRRGCRASRRRSRACDAGGRRGAGADRRLRRRADDGRLVPSVCWEYCEAARATLSRLRRAVTLAFLRRRALVPGLARAARARVALAGLLGGLLTGRPSLGRRSGLARRSRAARGCTRPRSRPGWLLVLSRCLSRSRWRAGSRSASH